MTAAAQNAGSKDWPADGLERVDVCPVCGGYNRSLLHSGLTDRVFFCAPGRWDIWQCDGCSSGFLDPRPTEATIGLAYSNYYTHSDGDPPAPTSALRELHSALANGYRNARFGTRIVPAIRAGSWLGRLVPPVAWPLETEFRHLPRLPRPGAKLLDVGCGGGEWLVKARQAGWELFGADPDPVAGRRASENGIAIRQGGTEAWLDQPGTFDAITSNHSLEHVHDPATLLREALLLLRPGGMLFIETPNLDSWGHRIYGAHWLGLDPPRHLILFNVASLRKALADAGFVRIRQRRRGPMFRSWALLSARLAAGHDFTDSSVTGLRLPGRLMSLRAEASRRRAEALVFTAQKPR